MSSASTTRQQTPQAGHVHLILFEQDHGSFYLEIPIAVIKILCLKPCKYLRYLGWCILGGEGALQDSKEHLVNLEGSLVDQEVYYYRLPASHQGFAFPFRCDLGLTFARCPLLCRRPRGHQAAQHIII